MLSAFTEISFDTKAMTPDGAWSAFVSSCLRVTRHHVKCFQPLAITLVLPVVLTVVVVINTT
jgi:hypothetical protein